jgi:lysosomal acid lipase/cholesteryl ester hydrolase
VLTAYRIKDPKTKDGAPVILLQHGIADSAYAWIMNHPEESPAFILAREGYDVWLGNQRGVGPSRKHMNYNPDSKDYEERKKFWDFSWQEMGDYDLPETIRLI